MKDYILITGASTGIGHEMALQLAEKKFNLILVARSGDKLEAMQQQLQSKFNISIVYYVKDLSVVQNARDLYEEVKSNDLYVTHLVNNAGFGDYGDFINTNLEHELNMINLNISSLVVLTKLFAQDMFKKGGGHIMNVASILSFLPFPYYSVYSATKCFVLSFTETIAAELDGTGVIVTALCPGTVETAFHTVEMRKTNAMSANKPMPASEVASAGVQLLLYGKGKKIVGFNNWFISNIPRVLPDFIMMYIKKNLASLKK